MNTEYTTSTVIVTNNMKIVFGIAVAILVGVGMYAYLHPINKSSATCAPAQTFKQTLTFQGTPYLSMDGKITGVSEDKLIMESYFGAKTITIDPTTRINRVIIQKNATSSLIDRLWSTEVNIADVQKGDIATVSYRAEKNNALIKVATITLTTYGNVDAYHQKSLKPMVDGSDLYLSSQVVRVDLVNKKLEYRRYPIVSGAATESVALPDGVPVYKVDTSSLAAIARGETSATPADIMKPSNVVSLITRVRTTATLADVKPDGIISLMVDNKSFQEGKVVLKAITIFAI